MNQDQLDALKRCFATEDGQTVLGMLSRACMEGCNLYLRAGDDRNLAYLLGRLSVLQDIRATLKEETENGKD